MKVNAKHNVNVGTKRDGTLLPQQTLRFLHSASFMQDGCTPFLYFVAINNMVKVAAGSMENQHTPRAEYNEETCPSESKGLQRQVAESTVHIKADNIDGKLK